MDINFNKNEDYNKIQVSDLKRKLLKVYKGGGEQKIEKHHAKGKLTARERIDYLLDKKSDSIEIGAFAGDEMYAEHGGCPSGGVVVKIGYISGKQCIVVANDATVKAGAWFPITGKKNLRAQEISIENKLPIIYLVDSAGVYLPMQDEIFPDKEHFGRIFRNNAVMSSMGITQISAIMGSCVAGGAYLPIMSDEAIIVDKTASIFLAGSYLVKAAIGESIDNETLGGATTHCEISGVTDYKATDDKDALDKIKNIFSKIGDNQKAGYNRISSSKPTENPQDIYGQKQAGKVWNDYSVKKLIKIGFVQSKINPCLFFRGSTLYALHTDDSILASPDNEEIKQIMRDMKGVGLDITDKEDVSDFLGVKIDKRPDGTIHML